MSSHFTQGSSRILDNEKPEPLPSQSKASESELGDHAQFVTLFARDNHRVFAFIYSMLHNRADAEDVFQRTSLILWQEFGKYDQERDFSKWACGIAFYTVRNFLRVSGRKRLTFNYELMKVIADERVGMRESTDLRKEALDECMKKLSLDDCDLVSQAYCGDSTIKEVAETMGRAVQTLYNRLNRIRKGLVECVDVSLADQSLADQGGGS